MNENDLKILNLCVASKIIKAVELTTDNELQINFEEDSIILDKTVFDTWFFKY